MFVELLRRPTWSVRRYHLVVTLPLVCLSYLGSEIIVLTPLPGRLIGLELCPQHDLRKILGSPALHEQAMVHMAQNSVLSGSWTMLCNLPYLSPFASRPRYNRLRQHVALVPCSMGINNRHKTFGAVSRQHWVLAISCQMAITTLLLTRRGLC